MNEILKELSSHSGEILAYLGSSAGLSSVLQGVKKRFNLDAAKKFVVSLLTVASFGGATLQYYLSSDIKSALPQILEHGSLVFTAAVLVHRFMVSPVYYKLTSYLKPIFQAASELRTEAQALQKSQTVAPTETPAPTPPQFSV